ncbi:MAG: hypothetical protein U9R07_12215, partial [Pseudomonadota bacterium]|nr:hypothetical protein [Pseudomonadota bacterium]
MHWIHKLLAAACLFFAGSQAASAAVVVIKFSGTVYNVTPSVASRFSLNDVVTGTVRLKTGATGQVAGSTVYIYPDAILNGLINVAGYIAPVRRQNIRHNSRRKLAECGPRLGVDVRRRACGVASADTRWSVA